MKRILEVLDRHLQLSLKINEVVGRLSEKRVTLEEKMIRSYFHRVGGNMMELAACFNRALASATTPRGNTTDAYTEAPLTGTQSGQDVFRSTLTTDQIKTQSEDFDQLLLRLESTIDELLKVLRYDLNFVEQYFEFNYYNKLTNEETFFADSQRLLDQFKKSMLS